MLERGVRLYRIRGWMVERKLLVFLHRGWTIAQIGFVRRREV